MLSDNRNKVYKKLILLRLLCVCLVVFGSLTFAGGVFGAKCIQDCEPDLAACYDNCAWQCATTDTNCNTCIANCEHDYNLCLGYAVWCSGGGYSYEPNCQVGYADHCPIINGITRCDDPSAHAGYYELCSYWGFGCVQCPGNERCTGANGLPPCP